MFKKCKECGLDKQETEFYKSPAYKDKICPRCKECTKKYDKSMIARIKDRVIPLNKKCCRCKKEKTSKEFYKSYRNSDGLRSACIECTNKQEKDYRTKKPEKEYFRKIKQKYGLSVEEHSLLIAEYDGKCAICKIDKKLVIDHSHKTGKIRGLLCSSCNSGLGMFGDKIEFLYEAIKYLEK